MIIYNDYNNLKTQRVIDVLMLLLLSVRSPILDLADVMSTGKLNTPLVCRQ